MIFEEIVLYNFGIYKGHHLIKLSPPSSQKNIILLGGLNGSGKTTLLDALQLALYGKFAKHSQGGNNNYLDYLARMINYHVDPKEGATLELQFKHFRQGKEESIRIHRSWHSTGKGIKERVEIKRDGILDAVITERWYEYVEEFIPSKISSLFFFDGEKIEAFADQDKAAELLKTGIQALLGLDLVYRLSTDLLTVERKRKTEEQSQENRQTISLIETELKEAEKSVKRSAQEKIKLKKQLETLKKQQESLKKEYRREGGELFEQRETIEIQRTTAQQNLSDIEGQLRDIAGEETPFLMIRDLLKDTEKQAIQEQKIKNNQIFYKELETRDAQVLELLKKKSIKITILSAIETFLKADQLKRQQSFNTKSYLNIDPTAFTYLQDNAFKQLHTSMHILLDQAEKIKLEIQACERKLASIPDSDSLKNIQKKLQKTEQDYNLTLLSIKKQEQEYTHLVKICARKEKALMHKYEIQTTAEFSSELTLQMLKQSKTVRNTLDKFAKAVTAKHINRLEILIHESFQELIRKDHFIKHISIDPNSYRLTLYTPSHEKLYPENLSAGERQLLAIAILWGLSRASGRPLPAIIDTPLSRLDGPHRKNLVDHYFHQASHQVILLSTDEEINKTYYKTLQYAIGHEYYIAYDEKKQSSLITSGYFFK